MLTSTRRERSASYWLAARERQFVRVPRDVEFGTFVEPSKKTVDQWLDEWVNLAIKPPRKTQRAYDTYRSVIALHLKPAFEHIRLQRLRTIDIERFSPLNRRSRRQPLRRSSRF